ncbi:MAG TPA: methyltransferase domain-containing protein, partial [Myxococcaceae bacterium]|nr:methyltransferase domain-containing protein [Myxococcaceae bacterium]
MSLDFRRLGPSELLPRYIFAEGLFARRRVLELGAVGTTAGESARFLIQRGARSVLAADSNLTAVEEAQEKHGGPQLRYRANVLDDLEAQSFDLILVADLGEYVRAPELLREVARVLAKNGCLLGGLRNPSGLALCQVMDPEGPDAPPTYGQLLDALSPFFPHVEVATQSPVLGYQLAFEGGEGLQVDGSLARVGEAAYFVVFASPEPLRLFDPTWVQLPPEPLAYNGGRLEEYAKRSKTWEERAGRLKESLARVRAESEARNAELIEVREALRTARDEAARATARLDAQTPDPFAGRDRDELAARVRRLESELQVAKERAEGAEARLGTQRSELEKAHQALREAGAARTTAEEAQRVERLRREELSSLLEDARDRLAKAYQEVGAAQEETDRARLEAERARMALERSEDEVRDRLREVEVARERESRLSDAQAQSLAAVDALRGELDREREDRQIALEALQAKEAELLRALRLLEGDSRAAEQAQQALTEERAARQKAEAETARVRDTYEAELEAARGEARRGEDARAEAAQSLQKAEALAASLEERLQLTREELEVVRGRADEAELRLEAANARATRFEKDIATSIA